MSTAGPPPISPNPPHRPPDDSEEVYFDGTPSVKGEMGRIILLGVISVVLIAGSVVAAVVTGGLGIVAIPVAVLIAAALMAWPVMTIRLRRYKITNYRIDFERGFLSKSIDTLELWHVEDIRFHQSLTDRMFGIGTLTIITHDDTTPLLEMKGLPEPRKLFDVLKQRVISVKRQRGVLKIDSGS